MAQFSENRIKAIIQDPNLTPEQKAEEVKKWDEGGIYRVAMHTAIGALGGGTLQSAATTGGVAAAAPLIDDLQNSLTKKLTEQGISEQTAKQISGVITSTAILATGTAAGLDTASTATAANVDAFNRQLHADEMRELRNNAESLARKHGISTEDAYHLLYFWAYSQVDDKANQELAGYLAKMEHLSQNPLHPSIAQDYQKTLAILQDASNTYNGLVSTKGSNRIRNVSDSQNQPVYMFKAPENQYNQSQLFGGAALSGGSALGISGSANQHQSGHNNNRAQQGYRGYFDSRISGYESQVLSTSGQVYQVYPEDWVGGAAILGRGATKLTGSGLANIAGRYRNTNLSSISTGRAIPNNLREQLAMEQVKSNPQGRTLPIRMSDSKNNLYAEDGWVKKAQNVNGIEIHYVENTRTGVRTDFKFKDN